MSEPSAPKEVAIPPDRSRPSLIQGLQVLPSRIVVSKSPPFRANTWTRRSDLSTTAMAFEPQPIWFHRVQLELCVCNELKIDPSAVPANASSLPAPLRSTEMWLTAPAPAAGPASEPGFLQQ